MPYKVQFVGLVCFYREGGARLALLPDGRNPGNGIDPHFASIVIHEDSIEEFDGWDRMQREDENVFPLDPCQIFIEGADTPGSLDVAEHERFLPQLRQIDPKIDIDPQRAVTIAKVPIRQGTLTAHRIPGGNAVVSQLVVPHDGSVTIIVKPDDGSPQRFIRAKAGAEIAITNMARGSAYEHDEERDGHFKIYEQLSPGRGSLDEPVETKLVDHKLPELKSGNPVFRDAGAIGLYISCSNTGCC